MLIASRTYSSTTLINTASKQTFRYQFSTYTFRTPKLNKMAPKKGAEVIENKSLLGRPSNNLKVGIVGILQIPSSNL